MNDRQRESSVFFPLYTTLSERATWFMVLFLILSFWGCAGSSVQVRDTLPPPKSQSKDKKPKEGKGTAPGESDFEEGNNASSASLENRHKVVSVEPPGKAIGLSEWGKWTGIQEGTEEVELSLEEGDEGEEQVDGGDEMEEDSEEEETSATETDEDPLPAVPLLWTGEVEKFVSYFQNRKGSFARWLECAASYVPLMQEILRVNGLPEDLVYLALIESGFNLHARSPANAQGPWQFIVTTGLRYGLRINRWIDERLDPIKSTQAACLYLKDLYDMLGGSWMLTKAGYNAGEQRVLNAIRKTDSTDFWYLARNGYLPRETRNYVPMFMAAAIIAKDPEKFGFVDLNYQPPFIFDEVVVPERTSLKEVARWAETDYREIKRLNPELKRGVTPPNYSDYKVKIPFGSKELFLETMAAGQTLPSQKAENATTDLRIKPSSKVKTARPSRPRVVSELH